MAGTDFGHALGPSRALPGLPLSPLVGGYEELVAAQQTLCLSHLGELLIPPQGHLRVLDGVFRVERHGRRTHLNAAALRSLASGRPEAAWLLDRLAGIQETDPAALRRILLYQLVHLLHDHPRGHLPATAAGLGIDPAETGALVHTAAGRARLTPAQRAAAEGLEDDVRRRRVRSAQRRAALLGAGGGDRALDARLAGLAALARAADGALDTARRHEERGERDLAGARYEAAFGYAQDCRHAVRGLVRTRGPRHGDPLPLDSALGSGGVELRWPDGPRGARSWRVLRLTRGDAAALPLAEVPGQPRGGVLVDRGARTGSRVRYLALPVGPDGLVDGPPLIGVALEVAPPVEGLTAGDGNGWIEAVWTPPAGAAGAEATLTGPEGPVSGITVHRDRLRAEGLAPGGYALAVRARYAEARGGAGGGALSAPVTDRLTVHRWPAPVTALTASARAAGGLDLAVTGPAGDAGPVAAGRAAEVRLVEWPGPPPAPGTALRTADLPPPLDWVGAAGADGLRTARPPAGALVTVAAVAVLGERALAGPSVLVEAPLPVTGLALRRTAPDQVQVTFDWPADTGTVTVTATQDGRSEAHTVTRSGFLREGLRLAVTPAALRVTAHAARRSAGSVPAAADGARAELPAEVTIAYELLPGARRGLRRGPAVLRITVRVPGADVPAPADLPSFVLVGRGDGSRNPHRPHGPSAGTVLCRVSGAELTSAGTLERALDPGVAPDRPYAVRGFLLGGPAASVRLQEPPVHTLVVR